MRAGVCGLIVGVGALGIAIGVLLLLLALGPNDDQEVTYTVTGALVPMAIGIALVGLGIIGLRSARRD